MDEQFDDMTYSVHEKLLVLDNDLRVIDASPAFYKTFGVEPSETIHRHLSELGNGQWNLPELLVQLNELAPTDGRLDAFELHSDFPGLDSRDLVLYARRSSNKSDGAGTIVLAIDDVTNQPGARAGRVEPRPPLISEVDSPIA